MTTDELDRLRPSNPVPHGSSAPPLERVLERIRAEEPVRRRWAAWTGALVPALGAAVAIAVVVVALVLVGGHHRGAAQHPLPTAPATGPGSVPAVPRGGMRGIVFLEGGAFPSASEGIISLEQCVGCRNGNPTAHASYRGWLLTTSDAGASWGAARRPWYVFAPRFQGSDGWAEGTTVQSKGGGMAVFYVTHDAGRSWSLAPAAAAPLGDQNVSVGSGEVWAIGSRGSAAAATVVHGPVTGSRLVATPAQPTLSGYNTNVEAVATGPHAAYVTNPNESGQNYVTHDDGRTWQRVPSPCPRGVDYGQVRSGGAPAFLWAVCPPRSGATAVARSIDGGQSWQTLPRRFAAGFQLEPVAGPFAWGVTSRGAVLRTSDAGSKWKTVWSVTRSQPASLTSHPSIMVADASYTPKLLVQDATDARIVMLLTRGHVGREARFTNFVVYRTTDGGATWHARIVPLPAR